MSKPVISCALRKRYLPVLLLLLLPVLACKASAPAAATASSSPATIDEIRINYPTGIETVHFEDGVTVVVDHKGPYAMGFPEQWEVGAFHEDFVPTVAKHCETHGAICAMFQALYEKDSSVRIFAIDTSPDHLTKDSIAILHIGMFQDERPLQLTIDELAAEYAAYINSTGQLQVTDFLEGTSNHGIPFAIVLNESVSSMDRSVYNAAALAKTDKVYLEVLYATNDETIDRVNEILPMLSTLTANIE
ncbi:MAG: hypothetical protein JW730_19605 [Anaerolineales bacterium]|nr:hypothetical protein [Anaerolineales bacterium]